MKNHNFSIKIYCYILCLVPLITLVVSCVFIVKNVNSKHQKSLLTYSQFVQTPNKVRLEKVINPDLARLSKLSVEDLTAQDVKLLTTVSLQELKDSCGIDGEPIGNPNGNYFEVISSVNSLNLLYYYTNIDAFYENADELISYQLVTRSEVFGVDVGEPLDKFYEMFPQGKAGTSAYWSDDYYSHFYHVRLGHLEYMFYSAENTEPVYTECRVIYNEFPLPIETTDPYLNLVSKYASELTVDDFKLILQTPAVELEQIYDLDPLDIPIDEVDALLFKMYENINYMPIYNLIIEYQGVDSSLPPASIDIQSRYDIVSGIQLGTTFADIEKQWGKGEQRRLYSNPMGYMGKVWQSVKYRRDGLVYSFRCMTPVNLDDYCEYDEWFESNSQTLLAKYGDAFPQVVERVVITLDGAGLEGDL